MEMVQIRAIDFFKIADAVGHPVDDVIKAWDGREYVSKDSLKDYLQRWKDRIKSGTAIPLEETVMYIRDESGSND